MKSIIQISSISSDTRYAKEIRIFGIPVWLERELDVRTGHENKQKPIGFQTVGDTSLLNTEERDDEKIDTKTYGKETH